MKACFFAKVASRQVLERVEFYANDVAMLRDFGFTVHIATRASELVSADLYFTWWWTWAFIPLAYAKLHRRPIVITGTFDYWNFSSRPVTERLLMRASLSCADANVFVSELELRDVTQEFPVRNPFCVPHAIDTQKYSPGSCARSSYIFTIATMRHWNGWRKSIPELIEAALYVRVAMPGVRFLIAGDSDGRCEALVKKAGLDDTIEFLGVISEEEKIQRMRECCIYLQPSRYEGFGVAIAEAMSCGAPVVTSAVGAVPEVVGTDAEFVDGESPQDIARGVLSLLSDAERRTQLGGRASARVNERFSLLRHHVGWRRVLDTVL